MKLVSKISFFTVATAVLWACSSSSTGDLADTAFSRAPRASEAVSTSGSSIINRTLAAATTGLGLATMANTDFGLRYTNYVGESDVGTEAGKKVKHFGPCQALNFTRGAIGMAANADSMLNILSAVIPEDEVSTYADGEYHVIQIDADFGEESESYKVKFRATLAGDQVTSADVFTCRESDDDS